MKRRRFGNKLNLLGLVVLAVALLTPTAASSRACLTGRVRVVNWNADYRVRVSDASPDMVVRLVDRRPTRPGEWQMVQWGEDFTVQLVGAGEDFRVRFGAWPGCR